MASSLNGTGVTFSDASQQSTARTPSNTVTSVAAGNGITVSSTVGAVTISQDVYTGTVVNNATYPIGTTVAVYDDVCAGGVALNASRTIYTNTSYANSGRFTPANVGGAGLVTLAGTWRCRGVVQLNGTSVNQIFQRTA